MSIPPHLKSTADLVNRAFPDGLPDSDYLPLLYLLSEYLSDRNLAIIVSYWRPEVDWGLNDVLTARVFEPCVDDVLKKLKAAGFDQWIQEE